MKTRLLIIPIIVAVAVAVLIIGTSTEIQGRGFNAFTFDIDEKYQRDGHIQFVVEKGSTSFLPVNIKPKEDASLNLHITTNFDQMGPPKLPRGINMYFEPSTFEIIEDKIIPVKIFIIVDDKAPANLYDVQIVGNWTNPDGSTDFMGSSFRLHVGKDFGDGKIPVNFNLGKIKQFFEDGVPIQEIPCKNDYIIIIKKSTGYPACVNPETAEKLIQRGWENLHQYLN